MGDHSSGCRVEYQRVEQWVISGRSEQRASCGISEGEAVGLQRVEQWVISGRSEQRPSSGMSAGGAVGDQRAIRAVGVVWLISR